jgi:hypothetical protein
MKNLSTRGRTEGGALASVVERWITDVVESMESVEGGGDHVQRRLLELCKPLEDLVSGFDFVNVVAKYYQGYVEQNEALQASAIRWLRAEYSNKTEARHDLGVRSIIGDATIYNYLKLFAKFVRIAGYSGLLVCLDELVVLSHQLNNRTARNNNYESILAILNDCLQGNVEGLGFVFAATEECIEDPRRGLYSYGALASRLARNRFVSGDMVDLAGPVIKLASLTPEECFVLLLNIRRVHARGDETKLLVPDEAIKKYLESCQQRMGAAYFQTPRETVKDFVGLLNALEQNPSADWRRLIGDIRTINVTTVDPSVSTAAPSDEEDLATFKL